jgi:undecaprenyl-diphosphatase
VVVEPSEPLYEPLVKLGLVSRFDRFVDEKVEEQVRGIAAVDRVFYAASAVGDHGVIWLILAVLRGLRSPKAWRATVRTAAAIGMESMIVNGPIKWVFRRPRPAPRGVAPHPLRRPRTSSFPSGHATSAFCAATLLSESDPKLRSFYFGVAVIVAWSRVHVRVHYASDVIGGALIGLLLGRIVKRLVPLAVPDPAPTPPIADEGSGIPSPAAALTTP